MTTTHAVTAAREPSGRGALRPWWRWTRWCGAGELLGFGAVGLAALLLRGMLGEPRTGPERLLTWLGMLAGGAAEGSALAWAQWRVLREHFPRLTLGAWWRPTVAAAMVGWGLGMLPSLLLAPGAAGQESGSGQPPLLLTGAMVVAGGAIAGAMFGAFQARTLRHHAHHAGRWIWANALGWGAGMPWLFLGASLPEAATPPAWIALSALASGALAGLVVGGVTGAVLVRLPSRAGSGR